MNPTGHNALIRESARESFAALAEEIDDRVATEMPWGLFRGDIDGSLMDCRVRRSRIRGARLVHWLWEGALVRALVRRIAQRQGPAREWL